MLFSRCPMACFIKSSVPVSGLVRDGFLAMTGNTFSVPCRPLNFDEFVIAPTELGRNGAVHGAGHHHRLPPVAAGEPGQPERHVGRIADHRVGRSGHGGEGEVDRQLGGIREPAQLPDANSASPVE